MARIRGIDVVLLETVVDGEDEFGAEILTEREVVISNVLVAHGFMEEQLSILWQFLKVIIIIGKVKELDFLTILGKHLVFHRKELKA